jgi:hypothetical protein
LSSIVEKWEYNETIHQLFIDYKKAYDSLRREELYNILIELGVCMKLIRLIKMHLRDTYSKVCMCKHLSDKFPIQNGLNQGDALLPFLSTLVLNMPLGSSRKTRWD